MKKAVTDACDTSLALGLALSFSGDGRENRVASPPLSAVSSYSAARTQSPEVRREKKFTGGEGGCSADSDGGAKKKLRLTKEQSAMLEDRFKEQSTLNPVSKIKLFVD